MMRAEFILVRRRAFQARFDLVRIFARGETCSVRNPKDVRIDGNSGLPKGFVQNDVCSLAADARQAHELVTRLRDFAAKLINDHLAERDDILGLVAPKPDGFDVTFDAFKAERQHLLRRIRDLEQPFGGFVHADIRGLRGERDRHDQRIRVHEVELGFRVRAILCEFSKKLSGFFFAEGAGRAFAFRRSHTC